MDHLVGTRTSGSVTNELSYRGLAADCRASGHYALAPTARPGCPWQVQDAPPSLLRVNLGARAFEAAFAGGLAGLGECLSAARVGDSEISR
jgi:hypothetical protein